MNEWKEYKFSDFVEINPATSPVNIELSFHLTYKVIIKSLQ